MGLIFWPTLVSATTPLRLRSKSVTPNSVFERGQGMAHRRLCQPNGVGRLRKTAGFSKRHEGLKLREVHMQAFHNDMTIMICIHCNGLRYY